MSLFIYLSPEVYFSARPPWPRLVFFSYDLSSHQNKYQALSLPISQLLLLVVVLPLQRGNDRVFYFVATLSAVLIDRKISANENFPVNSILNEPLVPHFLKTKSFVTLSDHRSLVRSWISQLGHIFRQLISTTARAMLFFSVGMFVEVEKIRSVASACWSRAKELDREMKLFGEKRKEWRWTNSHPEELKRVCQLKTWVLKSLGTLVDDDIYILSVVIMQIRRTVRMIYVLSWSFSLYRFYVVHILVSCAVCYLMITIW